MLMIIIGCNFLWGEINLTNNLIISIIDICIGGFIYALLMLLLRDELTLEFLKN